MSLAGGRRRRGQPARSSRPSTRTMLVHAPADPRATGELEKLRQVSHDVFDARTIDITWPIEHGAAGHGGARSTRICARGARCVDDGANILILSDRNLGPERVAIPSLLARRRRPPPPRARAARACGRARDRVRRAARDPPHGDADRLRRRGDQPVPDVRVADELRPSARCCPTDLDREEAEQRIVKAIGKGLLKMISKMGISTIQSYCGAQIFEAVGPRPGAGRPALHRHRRRGSAASGSTSSRPRRSSATSAPTRAPGATCCRSAACYSGAATASSTSGTRTRSPCCSTPCASENGDGPHDVHGVRATWPTRTPRARRRCAA